MSRELLDAALCHCVPRRDQTHHPGTKIPKHLSILNSNQFFQITWEWDPPGSFSALQPNTGVKKWGTCCIESLVISKNWKKQPFFSTLWLFSWSPETSLTPCVFGLELNAETTTVHSENIVFDWQHGLKTLQSSHTYFTISIYIYIYIYVFFSDLQTRWINKMCRYLSYINHFNMEQSKVHSSVRNHLTIQTFTQISSFTSSTDDKSKSVQLQTNWDEDWPQTKLIFGDGYLTGGYWTANVPVFLGPSTQC